MEKTFQDDDRIITGIKKLVEKTSQPKKISTALISSFYLFILALVLSIFGFPYIISFSLVAFNLAVSLLVTYYFNRRQKLVSTANAYNDGSALKNFFMQKELNDASRYLAWFCIMAVISLVFAYFFPELGSFRFYIHIDAADYFTQRFALILIGASLSYLLALFFSSLMRYLSVKSINGKKKPVAVKNDYEKLNSNFAYSRVSLIPVMVFSLFLPFMTRSLARFYVILIALTYLVIPILIFVFFRKQNKEWKDEAIEKVSSLYPNEQIAGSVFGISGLNKPSIDILDVGETSNPGNSVILTNGRLLFIKVPMPGAENIGNDSAYAKLSSEWKKGGIKSAGEKIIMSMPLLQVSDIYGVNDIAYNTIRIATLQGQELTIFTNNGNAYKFLIVSDEYIGTVKKCLSFYLKQRFIEKK